MSNVNLDVYASLSPSMSLSISPSFYLPGFPSISCTYLSICPSISVGCLPACLSVCLRLSHLSYIISYCPILPLSYPFLLILSYHILPCLVFLPQSIYLIYPNLPKSSKSLSKSMWFYVYVYKSILSYLLLILPWPVTTTTSSILPSQLPTEE